MNGDERFKLMPWAQAGSFVLTVGTMTQLYFLLILILHIPCNIYLMK